VVTIKSTQIVPAPGVSTAQIQQLRFFDNTSTDKRIWWKRVDI